MELKECDATVVRHLVEGRSANAEARASYRSVHLFDSKVSKCRRWVLHAHCDAPRSRIFRFDDCGCLNADIPLSMCLILSTCCVPVSLFGRTAPSPSARTRSGWAGKVKYFEGTPIPTSIELVGLLALAASQEAIGSNLWFSSVSIMGHTLHLLALLILLSGTLMISRIRIPKL